ncbi:hypothetical protein ACLOJK_005202 [Asimina triloba]
MIKELISLNSKKSIPQLRNHFALLSLSLFDEQMRFRQMGVVEIVEGQPPQSPWKLKDGSVTAAREQPTTIGRSSISTNSLFALMMPLEERREKIRGSRHLSSRKTEEGAYSEIDLSSCDVKIWGLSENQLAGSIPGELGAAEELLNLRLGSNTLTGAIPPSLGNFEMAWNMETNNEISLSGPVGQVYSLEANDELLFAGSQDGSILVWKFNDVGSSFEPAATLLGHNLTVASLTVGGARRLYSGSMDNTIRVWDLGTFRCLQTLMDHTSVVMSLLCWDQFLLGSFVGVLGLCGMHDAQAKPVLMCACDDNAVRVYDLPSFKERGKVLSKDEIRSIQLGPDGLFFTGDRGGALRVWKWRTT